MKHLVFDWSDDPDVSSETSRIKQVYDDYQRHLESLRGVLPNNVVELGLLPLQNAGIEDAKLIRVQHARARDSLRLVLRCGFLAVGYYDLTIEYDAVVLETADVEAMAIIGSRNANGIYTAELADYEFDVTESGLIAHRFRFHTNGRDIGFCITCASLHWRKSPPGSRRNLSFAMR